MKKNDREFIAHLLTQFLRTVKTLNPKEPGNIAAYADILCAAPKYLVDDKEDGMELIWEAAKKYSLLEVLHQERFRFEGLQGGKDNPIT